MPTSFTDQFYVVDPGQPPAQGTSLTVFERTFTDQNDDADIGTNEGDTFNGVPITDVWPGDTLTVNLPGGGQVTYTGVTFYLDGGGAVFTPTDGQILQDGTFDSSTFVTTTGSVATDGFAPPCFTPGTRIAVPGGTRAVEELRPGDLVLTRDHGRQPIRWAGRAEVEGRGDMAPVRIGKGALGNVRTLKVSPQHRMLLSGPRVELLFGHPEVLVPAVHLVDGDLVRRAPTKTVTYLHVLFDRHEIITADGIPTESFHPGEALLDGEGALRRELARLFPGVGTGRGPAWRTARPVLRAHEVLALSAA
ncbi:Hint domain-containing protein [Rhodobacteraceae bacterium CCMM004]|nr:Hint domain-containing protein [Rhodobacteraceae bacterium CCMM004]